MSEAAAASAQPLAAPASVPEASVAPAAEPLAAVMLAELRLRAGGRRWRVDQPIDGLDALTPVRGHLRVEHHGNALEVEGRAETIVTLCCDRCLQHYNHPLRVDCRELLELFGAQAAAPAAGSSTAAIAKVSAQLSAVESLVVGDDLDDRLDPRGSFDPERWLFEQLSLQLPLVNRCGADCPGPPAWGGGASEAADPRWAGLAALRHKPAKE